MNTTMATSSIDCTISNLKRALEHLESAKAHADLIKEQAFAEGVASVGGARTMSGEQFLQRLMNCVSPDSPGWMELHRLASSGFGRAINVEGS